MNQRIIVTDPNHAFGKWARMIDADELVGRWFHFAPVVEVNRSQFRYAPG